MGDVTPNVWGESQIIGGVMDPQKIRENMQRLSRFGGAGSPGEPESKSRSATPKPLWTPLPGDDLEEIEAEQRKIERFFKKHPRQKEPEEKTFTGPRGGRYRINSKGRKSYDVPELDT